MGYTDLRPMKVPSNPVIDVRPLSQSRGERSRTANAKSALRTSTIDTRPDLRNRPRADNRQIGAGGDLRSLTDNNEW